MAFRTPARLSTFSSPFSSRISSRYFATQPSAKPGASKHAPGPQPGQPGKGGVEFRSGTRNPQPPSPEIQQRLNQVKTALQGKSAADQLKYLAGAAEQLAGPNPESAEELNNAAKTLRDWAAKPYVQDLAPQISSAISSMVDDPTSQPDFPYAKSRLVDAIPHVDEVFKKSEAQRPESLYYNLMEEMSKKKLELEFEKIRANDEPSAVERLSAEQDRVETDYTARMTKILDDYINDSKNPQDRRQEVSQFRESAVSFEKRQRESQQFTIPADRLEKSTGNAARLEKEIRATLPQLSDRIRELRKALEIDYSQYKL